MPANLCSSATLATLVVANVLPIRLIVSLLALLIGTSALADNAAVRKGRSRMGTVTKHWACPSEGSELRFRLNPGRTSATSHKLGRCFRVIAQREKGYVKLQVPAESAMLAVFVATEALAQVVQGRERLRMGREEARNGARNQPGIYLAPGTPIALLPPGDEAETGRDELVQVALPPGDIVGTGWMLRANLKLTGRKRQSARTRGKAVWIPGRVVLRDSPTGKDIARLASSEAFVAAARLDEEAGHMLVSYQGQYAKVLGWIKVAETKDRYEPASDAEIGFAKIETSQFWLAEGDEVYDRPRGEVVGFFTRDAEFVGRALKNGWVQMPLPTEMGTLNLWSPVYSDDEVF